ncbi:MAG: hypothetical protein II561_05460 [Thermoguttaceae bacterium]|nr:hypothetical protein [Thermoguttaceae bacterium]MBQ2555984.1 hypothetical protein [Thermoguttaceae bacterium]MBQ5366532.1 hypothetical protein [Thermoguttaceae bacterium]
MTQSTQTIPADYETTFQRIDSQHDELIRKLDELDKQIADALAQWAPVGDAAHARSRRRRKD